MEKFNKISISLIICLVFSLNACSQNHASKAVEEVQDLMSEKIADKKRVVFSVADKEFLIITENGQNYTEYYITKSSENAKPKLDKTETKKRNKVFEKMFNEDNYQKEYITFDSDFYKPDGYELSSGNLTYFVFKDKNGKNYGEAKLSVFIKPNPIDKDVYLYLISQILNYNN